MLDGFGNFVAPPPTARPVPTDFAGSATADHPPGFYGPPEELVAVNTLAPADRLEAARFRSARQCAPRDLSHERAAGFARAGFARRTGAVPARYAWSFCSWAAASRDSSAALARAAAAIVAVAGTAGAHVCTSPRAGLADSEVPPRRWRRRLAYVVTGDANVDAISKAGLAGLTLFLAQRTALEAGDPIGLDIARDELAFYPLIYWPIVPGAPRPSDEALKRIDSYMKTAARYCSTRATRSWRRRAPAARPAARAWSSCARFSPRSTFPSLSRCRAITF